MKLDGHKDARGDLFWLDKKNMEFSNMTVGTINPCCKRGGHYHKITSEKILCVSGILTLELNDKKTKLNPGDIINISKKCVHTLYNYSDETGFFVELKNSVSNNKPDIFYK